MRADKIAVLVALEREAAAIDHQFGALIDAGLHQAFDIGLGGGGHNGAVIDLRAVGIGADLQLLDAGHQLFDQAVGGFLAHRDGHGDGHAAFARRAVTGTDQRVRRLVQIGVGHDDHVVLGAAKALHALALRTAGPVDVFGNRGRADKADRLDHRVVEDRVNRFLVAVDDLQHALGQARFFHQLGQHQRHGGVTFDWV